MRKELDVDVFATHLFDGLENVNKSIETLHSGECLRAIVKIGKYDLDSEAPKFLQISNNKVEGGYLK